MYAKLNLNPIQVLPLALKSPKLKSFPPFNSTASLVSLGQAQPMAD